MHQETLREVIALLRENDEHAAADLIQILLSEADDREKMERKN